MAKRILVVDDEKPVCDYVQEMLEHAGYEVTCVLTGQAALQHARQDAPDAIVLDINMPKMTGCAVSVLLENNEKTKNIPIIFLTGYIDREEASQIDHKLAGQILIAKPFEKDELLSALDKVLSK